jgi:REP element-mobilizing transposase RayT
MSHSLCSLHIHVVFSTAGRLPLITAELKPRLFAYLGGIVRQLSSKAVIINGMPDHVHMLLTIPPTLAVAECMRVVKANSSRWARQNGHRRFAWQTGYSAFSVSTSQMPRVVRYVQEQEKHHRRISFQQELLSLLRKNGVEFDERYLWN